MKFRSDILVNALQTAAIVLGLVYGGVQVAQFRDEQRRQSNMELARSFMTPDFHRAMSLVLSAPAPGAGGANAFAADEMPNILNMLQAFETVGVLVHQGEMDIAIVNELMGSEITAAWRRMAPTLIAFREARNDPHSAQWFQWLAERLVEYRARTPAPAYEAYREWQPGD